MICFKIRPKVNNHIGLLLLVSLLPITLKKRPIWSHCSHLRDILESTASAGVPKTFSIALPNSRQRKKKERTYTNGLGNGCGSVGRAVAYNTRDLRFKSSHRQIFMHNMCCLHLTVENTKNEKKRLRMARLKDIFEWRTMSHLLC